jgi:SPP1 gp7 family putative phage head morphogenesis protein
VSTGVGAQADVLRVVRDFRRQLLERDAVAVARIMTRHRALETRMAAQADALARRIASAQAAGLPVNASWLHTQGRLTELLDQVRDEVAGFAADAAPVVRGTVASAAELGQRAAGASVATAAGGLSGEVVAATLPTGALQAIEAVASAGGPVGAIFATFGDQAAGRLRDELLAGVAQGEHPTRIAARMRSVADVPRRRAVLIARTEVLRAYRSANVETWAQMDVVQGWVWIAALDRRTCAACWAMHGTVHPDGTDLESHPACRCVPAPNVPGQRRLVAPGAEQLKAMARADLTRILGPGRAADLLAGRIQPQDLVATRTSPVWGLTRTEAGRARALANARQRKAGRRTPGDPPRPPVVPEPPTPAPTPPPGPAGELAAAEARLADLQRRSDDLRAEIERRALAGEDIPSAMFDERRLLAGQLNEQTDEVARLRARLAAPEPPAPSPLPTAPTPAPPRRRRPPPPEPEPPPGLGPSPLADGDPTAIREARARIGRAELTVDQIRTRMLLQGSSRRDREQLAEAEAALEAARAALAALEAAETRVAATARGRPAGEKFRLIGTVGSPAQRQAVETARENLSAVLSRANVTDRQVETTLSNGLPRHVNGRYQRSGGVKLSTRQSGGALRGTAYHEWGHALDWTSLGGEGGYASWLRLADADMPGRQAMERLMDSWVGGPARARIAGQFEVAEPKYFRYLDESCEVFARAFAQWVALRADDVAYRALARRDDYWRPDEFEAPGGPAEAMDRLFGPEGLDWR